MDEMNLSQRMIKNLAIGVVDKVFNESEKEDIRYLKAQYIVELIISDFSKIVLLLIFFCALEKLREALFCVCFLALTRRYIGGNHAKTYCGCIMMSLACFLISIFLSEWQPLVMAEGIYVVWIIFVVIRSINTSKQHDKKIDGKGNMKAIIFVLLMALVLKLIATEYLKIGAMILLFQMTLLIGKEMIPHECNSKTEKSI